MNEPVLLVGETGVGKTAVVNYLSQLTGNHYKDNIYIIPLNVVFILCRKQIDSV